MTVILFFDIGIINVEQIESTNIINKIKYNKYTIFLKGFNDCILLIFSLCNILIKNNGIATAYIFCHF